MSELVEDLVRPYLGIKNGNVTTRNVLFGGLSHFIAKVMLIVFHFQNFVDTSISLSVRLRIKSVTK